MKESKLIEPLNDVYWQKIIQKAYKKFIKTSSGYNVFYDNHCLL